MDQDSRAAMLQKIEIMIDIMVKITQCSYSDAESIIKRSKTYYMMEQSDYSAMYDSPQANLASIGNELRARDDQMGDLLTDENIRNAMKQLREENIMANLANI